MSAFTEYYEKLIILQYYNKPKAKAEIGLHSARYDTLFELIKSFSIEFDLETAWGDRLDKIGKIVGRSRILERGIPKIYFGFAENPNSKGFGEAPFYRLRDAGYERTEMDDTQYRFFIKAQIIKNTARAVMSSEIGISLQDAVQFLFSSKAYIVDNKNMSMTLYVDKDFDFDLIRTLEEENLIPTPQGVGFRVFIKYDDGNTFGFAENPNAKGFGAGTFARIA